MSNLANLLGTEASLQNNINVAKQFQREANQFAVNKGTGGFAPREIGVDNITGFANARTSAPDAMTEFTKGSIEALIPAAGDIIRRYEQTGVPQEFRSGFRQSQDRLTDAGMGLARAGGQMLGALPIFMKGTNLAMQGIEATAKISTVEKLGLAADSIAAKVASRVAPIVNPVLNQTSKAANYALKSPIITSEVVGAGLGVGYDYGMAKSNKEEFDVDNSLAMNVAGGFLGGGIEGGLKTGLKYKVGRDVDNAGGVVEIVNNSVSDNVKKQFINKDSEFVDIGDGKSQYIYTDAEGNDVAFVKDENDNIRVYAKPKKGTPLYDDLVFGSTGDGEQIAKASSDYTFKEKPKPKQEEPKRQADDVKFSIVGQDIAKKIIDENPNIITANTKYSNDSLLDKTERMNLSNDIFLSELKKMDISDTDKIDAIKEFDSSLLNEKNISKAGITNPKKAVNDLRVLEKETSMIGGSKDELKGYDIVTSSNPKKGSTEVTFNNNSSRGSNVSEDGTMITFKTKASITNTGDNVLEFGMHGRGGKKTVNLNSDDFKAKVKSIIGSEGKTSFTEGYGTTDASGRPENFKTIGFDEKYSNEISKFMNDIKDNQITFPIVGKKTTTRDVEGLLASKIANKIKQGDEAETAERMKKHIGKEDSELDFEEKTRLEKHTDVGVAPEDYGDMYKRQTKTLNAMYRTVQKAFKSAKFAKDAKAKANIYKRAENTINKILRNTNSEDMNKANELLAKINASDFDFKEDKLSILNDNGLGFNKKFLDNINTYNKKASEAREILKAKTLKEAPVKNLQEKTREELNIKKAVYDKAKVELDKLKKAETKDPKAINLAIRKLKSIEKDIKTLESKLEPTAKNEKVIEREESQIQTKEIIGSETSKELNQLKNVYTKAKINDKEAFEIYNKIKDVDMTDIKSTDWVGKDIVDKEGNRLLEQHQAAGLTSKETGQIEIDYTLGETTPQTMIHETVHKLLKHMDGNVDENAEKIFNQIFDKEERAKLEKAFSKRKDLSYFKEDVIADVIGRAYANFLYKSGIIDSPVNYSPTSLNRIKADTSIAENFSSSIEADIKNIEKEINAQKDILYATNNQVEKNKISNKIKELDAKIEKLTKEYSSAKAFETEEIINNKKTIDKLRDEVDDLKESISDATLGKNQYADMADSFKDEIIKQLNEDMNAMKKILEEKEAELSESTPKNKFILDIFESNETDINSFIGKSPMLDAMIMKMIKETNSSTNNMFVDFVRKIKSDLIPSNSVNGKDFTYMTVNKVFDAIRPYTQKYQDGLIDAINEVSWTGYFTGNAQSVTMRRIASMLNGYHMATHNSINAATEGRKQFINQHFGKFGNADEILGKLQSTGIMQLKEMYPDKSFDEVIDMIKNKTAYSKFEMSQKIDVMVDEIFENLSNKLSPTDLDKLKELFKVTQAVAEPRTKTSFKDGKKNTKTLPSYISELVKMYIDQTSETIAKQVVTKGGRGKGYKQLYTFTIESIADFNKIVKNKLAREFNVLARKSGISVDEATRISKIIKDMDLSKTENIFTDNYMQEYAALREVGSQLFMKNSILNTDIAKVKQMFDSEAFAFLSKDINAQARELRNVGVTNHNFGLNPENLMTSRGFRYITSNVKPKGAISSLSYKLSNGVGVYAVPNTKEYLGQQDSLFGSIGSNNTERGVDTVTVKARFDPKYNKYYFIGKDGKKDYLSDSAVKQIVRTKDSKKSNGIYNLSIKIPDSFKKYPIDTEGRLYNQDSSKMYQRNLYLKAMNDTKNEMVKKALLEASRNDLFVSEGKYSRMDEKTRNKYVYVDIFGNKGYVPKQHAANFTGTRGIELNKSKNAWKYYILKYASDFTKLVKNNIIVGSMSSFINSAVSSISIYSLHSESNNPMSVFRNVRNADAEIQSFYDLQKQYSNIIASKGDRAEILKKIESHPFYNAMKLGLPVSIRNAEINLGLMNRNGILTSLKNGLGLGSDTMSILDNFMLQPKSGVGMFLSDYFDRTEIVPKYALYKEKIASGMKPEKALDYVNFAFPYYKMNLSEGMAIADNFIPFMKFFMSVPQMIKHAFDNKSNALVTMQALSFGGIAAMNQSFEDTANTKEQKLQDYGLMSLPSEYMYSVQSLNPYTTHTPEVLNVDAYQRAFFPYDVNPLTYVGASK